MRSETEGLTGNIFSIERHALHDGRGIRTIVYFKGCPLRCLWCCNPESQETRSHLAFFGEKCISCQKCIEVCPEHANRLSDAGIEHSRDLCTACGRCVDACPADARRLWGRRMTVADVLAEVRKDIPFFFASGGGVTISGGEATIQAPFVGQLLLACREQGIHTALETCGFVPWATFKEILPLVDQWLYDLKTMDCAQHVALTGASNQLILDNARRLAEHGAAMTIRAVVIPGCNDSDEDIHRLTEFVKGLPGPPPVELLPYHPYGLPKYERLGRRYPLPGTEPPTPARVSYLRELVRSYGLHCEVS